MSRNDWRRLHPDEPLPELDRIALTEAAEIAWTQMIQAVITFFTTRAIPAGAKTNFLGNDKIKIQFAPFPDIRAKIVLSETGTAENDLQTIAEHLQTKRVISISGNVLTLGSEFAEVAKCFLRIRHPDNWWFKQPP